MGLLRRLNRPLPKSLSLRSPCTHKSSSPIPKGNPPYPLLEKGGGRLKISLFKRGFRGIEQLFTTSFEICVRGSSLRKGTLIPAPFFSGEKDWR